MNLYLISQDIVDGWDTYDSAVVAAKNEKKASETHPIDWDFGSEWDPWESGSWCHKPEQVEVGLIGKAKPKTEAGVICSSFNAG